MNYLRITKSWIGLVTVFATYLSSAQVYSIKDLGVLTDVAGRTDAKPNGINSKAQVVEANAINGTYQALLHAGSWTNIGTLGGVGALASGLNDQGLVVGESTNATGSLHAFLWTPGGTDGVPGNPQMKDLGTLGGADSQAFGINNSGQICGYSDVPTHPTAQQRAFVYSGGKMTDIGLLLTALPNSFGYGINGLGHVAGTAYDAGYAIPHAFFYDGSTAVDIGGSSGAGSYALAINDADHIAGYAVDTNDYTRAFHYAGGVRTDLGTLGGHYSYGIGINNSNVIVGGSFIDTDDSVYHAFVCANNTMLDLNTLAGAEGAGWTLVEARAINDAGQIAGVGTYAGSNHSFLLTPGPKILAVSTSRSNVAVSFTSVSNYVYSIEFSSNLLSGSWSVSLSNIVGNGGVIAVTNIGGATLPRGFYRVRWDNP